MEKQAENSSWLSVVLSIAFVSACHSQISNFNGWLQATGRPALQHCIFQHTTFYIVESEPHSVLCILSASTMRAMLQYSKRYVLISFVQLLMKSMKHTISHARTPSSKRKSNTESKNEKERERSIRSQFNCCVNGTTPMVCITLSIRMVVVIVWCWSRLKTATFYRRMKNETNTKHKTTIQKAYRRAIEYAFTEIFIDFQLFLWLFRCSVWNTWRSYTFYTM